MKWSPRPSVKDRPTGMLDTWTLQCTGLFLKMEAGNKKQCWGHWRTSRQSTRACSWGRRSGSASSWSCCPGLGRRRWCSWGWGRSDGGRRRRRTWHSAGSWRPNLAASLVYKLGDVKPFQHLSDFKSSQMSLYLLVAFCYVLDICIICIICISYLHELIWKGTEPKWPCPILGSMAWNCFMLR